MMFKLKSSAETIHKGFTEHETCKELISTHLPIMLGITGTAIHNL